LPTDKEKQASDDSSKVRNVAAARFRKLSPTYGEEHHSKNKEARPIARLVPADVAESDQAPLQASERAMPNRLGITLADDQTVMTIVERLWARGSSVSTENALRKAIPVFLAGL